MRWCAAALLALLAATPAWARPGVCDAFDGAAIVNKDGDFIGKLTSKFDSDSIFNKFGNYGSKFSGKSIWDKFGEFGGQFSDKSPFNKYASKSPLVVANGRIIAVLNVNDSIQGAVNPITLAVTCYDYTPD